MRITLSKSKSAEQVYITKAYRDDNGKSTSKIFKKLGSMADLLPEHGNNRDKVIAWAKEQARICTEAEKDNKLEVPFELSENKQLSFNEMTQFNGGYLFLQKTFSELGLDRICKSIDKQYGHEYSLSDILLDLICSRILSPSSIAYSYEYMQQLIEQPSFSRHDIYRALDVIDEKADEIQSAVYHASNGKRNTSILYYDCTNFFFEIEEEKGLRKYGKGKEHRPNPIVQMGLFLDGDGIPLAFTVFPGNENEQPSLIPIEKRIMKDYELSKFIICTDAGLASSVNRRFNDRHDRSFIVTQSLKKLKKHLKEWALDPEGWHLGNSLKEYDISKIDEESHYNSVFHKERWVNEGGFQQRMIASYCPKYKHYQREVRGRQIERAIKIVDGGKNKKTHNTNSPSRFVDEIQLTMDGEVAEQEKLLLDDKKIAEEEKYDGFSAVCTTLDDAASEIMKVNRRRWEIEESFRIMKSEFKARPVFVSKDEHIRAHFFICFLSLLVYRLLEKKLGESYTLREIVGTLKDMNFHRVKGIGYIPCYTRTEITDALHETFGFRTDKQIVPDKKMKEIIRSTKR